VLRSIHIQLQWNHFLRLFTVAILLFKYGFSCGLEALYNDTVTQRPSLVPPILRELKTRIAPPHKKGQRLTNDDRLWVIWGLSRGWSDYTIAAKIQCDRSTVWRYKQRLYEDPSIVFHLPLILWIGKREFRCQLCGETRTTRMQCMRHVLAHFLPYEIARDCDLSDLKRPL
jgi:hypothetical protein